MEACFNGANAFQRWIHRETALYAVELMRLQWGQRLSALDTNEHERRNQMAARLQWGQRLSALDT